MGTAPSASNKRRAGEEAEATDSQVANKTPKLTTTPGDKDPDDEDSEDEVEVEVQVEGVKNGEQSHTTPRVAKGRSSKRSTEASPREAVNPNEVLDADNNKEDTEDDDDDNGDEVMVSSRKVKGATRQQR